MSYELDMVSLMTKLYDQLSDAERKIATLILDDLSFAAHASISELAKRSEVSEATITRFAKSMHCKNVRDLKLRLAQSLAVGHRFISDVKIESSGIHGVYETIKKALDHNSQLISADTINTAVEMIAKARQILIFGVGGGSTIMAQECQHRFFRLGFAATAYSDPMLMRMAAAAIDSNDVVIGLSLGGYSPDVTEAIEIARAYSAPTIAVTPIDSPLGKTVDLVIPIEPIETDYIFQPSASRYVMMAALDVLATELAIKNKRKSREKLRRLKHNLDNHKHGKDRLPLGD